MVGPDRQRPTVIPVIRGDAQPATEQGGVYNKRMVPRDSFWFVHNRGALVKLFPSHVAAPCH
jgi:hypothetical protein